jgi:hypothetical protein
MELTKVPDLPAIVNTVDPREWKVRVDHRDRNRMKINFKLNQQQTEAYEHFRKETMPEGISEEDYVRSIFFLGLDAMERRLVAAVEEAMREQQAAAESDEAEVDIDEIAEDVVEAPSDSE